jgi:predicted dinucleotide-utilizing enzyme
MSEDRKRIGIVGYGYIGKYVYEQLASRPELGLEVAFVHNRSREKIAALPPGVVLEKLEDFASREAELIVELAHPSITQEHGAAFLAHTDYMPLSLTALADAQLEKRLLETARRHGTCLYIPHGAVVGMDALEEGRQVWEEVRMTMKKPPRTFDFSASPQWRAEEIRGETVLYQGPTRGICPLFPRNVNSHAAVALGGIGFDRTRSVLIADPKLEVSVIEIEMRGQGVEVKVERRNPMKGVSGVFTLVSTLASICRAKGPKGGMQLC